MTENHTSPEATTFAVVYAYRADTARQDVHLPAHLAYLSEQVENGALLVSGPSWGPDGIPGGLLVYAAEDRAAVQAIVDDDPFVINGVTTSVEVHEWLPLVGPLSGGYRRAVEGAERSTA